MADEGPSVLTPRHVAVTRLMRESAGGRPHHRERSAHRQAETTGCHAEDLVARDRHTVRTRPVSRLTHSRITARGFGQVIGAFTREFEWRMRGLRLSDVGVNHPTIDANNALSPVRHKFKGFAGKNR